MNNALPTKIFTNYIIIFQYNLKILILKIKKKFIAWQ